MIDNLAKARDATLGPEQLRTRDRPTVDKDGVYTGGTAFERDMRAKPLEHGIRAFTLTLSLEKQRNIVAPCAATKIMGEVDPHLIIRRELTKVRSTPVQFARNVLTF